MQQIADLLGVDPRAHPGVRPLWFARDMAVGGRQGGLFGRGVFALQEFREEGHGDGGSRAGEDCFSLSGFASGSLASRGPRDVVDEPLLSDFPFRTSLGEARSDAQGPLLDGCSMGGDGDEASRQVLIAVRVQNLFQGRLMPHWCMTQCRGRGSRLGCVLGACVNAHACRPSSTVGVSR